MIGILMTGNPCQVFKRYLAPLLALGESLTGAS